MKTFGKIILIALASGGLSQAAVVITASTYTGPTVGIALLGDTAAPLTSGNRCWSVGWYPVGFNFATATPATILSNFTYFGAAAQVTNWQGNVGISSNISMTLPANDTTYTGKVIYTLVGNATTLAAATEFAVLTNNTTFPVVDGAGNGSGAIATLTSASVKYGTVLSQGNFTEPSGMTFASGVQLVPEPSAALLGALGVLGLLRRRRI